jgi:glycosidase
MLKRARAAGVPNFHIFGEVAAETVDVAQLARHTRVDQLPSVLDFGFARAVERLIAGNEGTAVLARLYEDDGLYEGGAPAAQRLPTFTGNHDFGRFAYLVRQARPSATGEEVLKRVMLGNAMLFLLRGVPVVYYGDEQGFIGHGGDQDARQDMFASQVASYNDQPLLGTTRTTALENFDALHPLYRQIATLALLRKEYVGLRRGRQEVRAQSREPGLFAASRIDNAGREILVAFNTSLQPLSAQVQVEVNSVKFSALAGTCSELVTAPGSLKVELPPLGYVACAAEAP